MAKKGIPETFKPGSGKSGKPPKGKPPKMAKGGKC